MLRFLAVLLAIAAPIPALAHEADQFMRHFCAGSEQEIKKCESVMMSFRTLYKKAFRNDYQAQRNLAYTLWNGNDVVVKDRKLSCAWRVAIIWLGSPKVDDSDHGNMKTYCGMVFPDERLEALDLGKMIGRRVKAGGKIDETIPDTSAKPGLDSTAHPL
ncbi:hypothetical protein [Ancylobacter pratisalsi]|uniref:DUF1311 domain-containing protein n=1 Tax=Ancylobacter pratisalsi TaxID=1745854 RepID=A0A6P1YK73_9HYPH|nr:hypothetical protein [Ancylobacter pratisalsi]QIB33728.1 hypothetical protein G3A50_08445 [Ancylobacter pratisalsi]